MGYRDDLKVCRFSGNTRSAKRYYRKNQSIFSSKVGIYPGRLDLTAAIVSKHASEFQTDVREPQMAKPTSIKIRLNSSADTGFFYVTKKNPRTQTEKLVLKKYDPVVRKHVEFKEGKIK